MNLRSLRLVGALFVLAVAAWSADETWDGGGSDNDWTTNQNWGNNNEPDGASDGATMDGNTRTTPNLDANIVINRLTFAATADDFTIAGSNTLTLGGTDPIIEVLAGTQTISSQFAVTGDLTIIVYSGASLAITDTAIGGGGSITVYALGTASVTIADTTGPSSPTWVLPASDGATTTDTTPTWTWASGGGTGSFRIQLDGGGWIATTATTFTPGAALGAGSHSLEVQERDAAGNWSASASRSAVIDATAPHITARATRDLDGDGHLDAVHITFSEAMTATAGGTWTVAGYTVGTPAWQSTTVLRLPLTELAAYDTGATPQVRYTSGVLQDAASNLLATEASASPAADAAAPIIVRASGAVGATALNVVFSEGVATTASGGNLIVADLSYGNVSGGGATGIASVSQGDATAGSAAFAVNAAFVVGDLGTDTIAAVATSIFDLVGNAMGTTAVAIAAGPSVPAFSAPAATTTDSTPTWSWASGGGGAGTYRFKLDDSNLASGATTTTSTSYTPGAALGDGSHTLYVQESDANGTWSATASRAVAIDATAPAIIARVTRDGDVNGQIDAVRVTFAEPMSGAHLGTWTVAGYTVGTPSWTSTTILSLPLTELGTPDTGALPAVRYTAGTVQDAAGNLLATEGAGTAATDGAAPVLSSAVGSGNSVTATFSEPVVTTSGGSGNLQAGDFTYVGSGSSVSSLSDGNGLDQSVTLSTSGAVSSGSDTIAAAATQIYDLAGNAMGTAAVVIAAPVTAKETIADGNWDDVAIWQGGVVPVYSDNVVVKHAVVISQGGFDYSYRDVNTLVIEAGGSITAQNDVSSTSYYTIIGLYGRSVEARATTTLTNVHLYDVGSGDTVIKVSSGCVLTLACGNQGHFMRSVVKQGAGELVWDSPANSFGGYDLGPTRVEAGTMRLLKLGARPAGYDLTVFGGATVDLQQDFSVGYLSGQGVLTRSTNGTTNLSMNGSAWSGSIQNGGAGKVIAATLAGGNVWSGGNSFTGGLAINGNLDISGTAAIADACAVSVTGTLTVNDPETVGPLSGSGSVVLNNGLTVNQAAQSTILSAAVSGSGSLTVLGAGSANLDLQGANSYAGGTVVQTGAAVIVSSNANLGAASGGLTLDGGTLRLTGDINLGSVTAASTADGSYPSTTIAASAADRPVSITANDGTIDIGVYSIGLPAFSTAVGQDLTIAAAASGDRTLFVDTGAGSAVWAGRLLSSGNAFGWLVKRGSGTLDLTNAANTWSKAIIRPEQGTLRVAAGGALGTVSSWIYTLSGATFEIASGMSSGVVHYLAGTMQVSGGTTSWSGTTHVYPAASPTNVPTFDISAGSVLDLGGTVTSSQPWEKTGPGTMIISSGSGSNAGLTAAGTVSGGTLQIARDDQLGSSGNGITLRSGGTLALTASFTTARGVTLGSGGGVVSTGSGVTLSSSGVVSGSGALTKSGSGTLVLGGSNTFLGGSFVQSGILQAATDAGLGAATSAVTLDGGTLVTTATFAASASRGLVLAAGGGSVEVAASTALTWNGPLSGSGALSKNAAGTLVLAGSNGGYAGTIAVQAGALRATSSSALGSAAAGTSVAAGAALELAGSFSSSEPLQLSGAGPANGGVLSSVSGAQILGGAVTLVQSATPVTMAVAAAGSLGVSSVVAGAGGLSKIGAGDLTLSGANTFTGTVAVAGGRLLVSANNHLGDGDNGVSLDGGTLVANASITAAARTLRITANDGSIDIPGAGDVLELPGLDTAVGQDLTLAGAGVLRLNIATGGSTIAGLLASTGTAGLTKAGAGGLALTAANTGFTTTTTINGGRVRLDGALGGPVVVQSGAILGGTGTMGALSVQAGGTLKPGDPQAQGPGVLTAASLSLASGATLDYDLGTANDLVSVTGTASVAAGVQLNVLSFPAAGSFSDGVYVLINAGTSTTFTTGTMTASLPNGYDLSAAGSRASIGVNGTNLVLTADSVLPVIASITSVNPDGTYYQGDAFDVTVQFSKPVTPSGDVIVQLSMNNGGAPVIRDVTITAGSYPATQFSGTYTVLSGDLTAPGEVNATAVVLAGTLTDAVGHAVTGTLTAGGSATLSSSKNIVIDNFVPLLEIAGASAGDTQPLAVTMNTLENRIFDPALNDTTYVKVLASDQETVDPAQLTYRLLLEPSQGEVQLLTSGTWAVGTTMRVVTTVTDALTQVATFTQADIDAGTVRYRHTSLAGGNDAILANVTDGDGKVSALYLIRFAVSGNAVPVIAGLPGMLTYAEESTHAVWLPLTSAADVTDNDGAFPDGRLSVALTGAQTGDQIDLRPDATGVTVSGSQISVGSVVVGTLTRTSATSLEVRFDDPTTAGPSEAEAIINAIGYRTVSQAPDPSIARTVQISITDGSAGQTPNVYVIPLQFTLFNDPPVITVGVPIVTVPGLARTFTVSVVDPEGEPALTYAIAAPPSPQAVRGALVQSTPGVFTYTPYYPSPTAVGDPLLDNFAIVVTDADFDPGSADPLRRGTAVAVSATSSAYTVRISDGGGDAPRFLEPMRMTVASGLPFAFQPQVQAAAGASLTWELVGAPVQLTAAFALAPPNQASFDTVSGQLSWPAVPSPADGSGYHRFGILVTDSTTQTATLLPVMLRVGPGGAG